MAVAAAVTLIFGGCATPPPGAERGPEHTIAYNVLVESSPPGAHIEANGRVVGNAPLHLKIFGGLDGKFHDFGSPYFVMRALPATTNQFVQVRVFRTGQGFEGKDRIPERVELDMSQPSQPSPPVWPRPPGYYYGPPPYYYPYYYGPRGYFYYGPYWHHW